ncbi:hypothetical protein C6A85_11190, partial [Mycobacterium sp. ITM-2017-0098]
VDADLLQSEHLGVDACQNLLHCIGRSLVPRDVLVFGCGEGAGGRRGHRRDRRRSRRGDPDPDHPLAAAGGRPGRPVQSDSG